MKETINKQNIENLTTNKCLFIGELANLNEEVLNSLLLCEFIHIYLINAPSVITDYIQSILEKDSLTVADNLSQVTIKSELDICFLGFPPISNGIFSRFKNINRNVLVFFDEEIGGFKTLWNKAFKNLKIIEMPPSTYFSSKNNQIFYVEKIDKIIPEFFTNRGYEMDAFRTFSASTRHRAAKIIGFDGIGKKAFINNLKRYHKLEENCFEFHFNSNNDSLFDIVNILGKQLSVKIIDKEISTIKKDYNPSSIIRLFEKFDKIEDAKIIFTNFNLAFDINSNNFFDNQIGVFFHNFLNRTSYRGNRMYFISNADFAFPFFQSDDLCFPIVLPAIHSKHIKIIMEREFILKNKQILATRVMQLSDESVRELINGHPHIAKMFVKACENAAIDTIINDKNFRKKFEDDKIKYLYETITLNSNNKYLDFLNYLSFVNGKFEKKLLDKICGNENVEVINYLRSRFFLEIEFHENKIESYEVPTLIRKYIKSNVSKGESNVINNFLGDYFWKIATDFKTPTIKMIDAYRQSEFHFYESGNLEMQKQLISLFKEKYLQKAISLYDQHQYKEAYFLYKELYERNYINDNKNANFFIVSCSKINASDSEKYMLKVHNDFPESKFITNTIAKYYYDHLKFNDALNFVSKSIDIQSDDYVAQSLYYNILSKTGEEEKAFEYYEKKMKSHLNPKLDKDEKDHLIKDLMNYSQILQCNKFFYDLVDKISSDLRKPDANFFSNYLNLNIGPENAQKISNAFAIALNSKYSDLQLKKEYENYILRQNNFVQFKKNDLQLFKINHAEYLKNFKAQLMIAQNRFNKSLEIIKIVESIDVHNHIAKLARPIILINQYNLKLILSLMPNVTEQSSKTKIVFASANPDGESNLRLDREYRAIDQLLQASKDRDKIELLSKWATRLSDFTKIMMETDPKIIHFSGHGNQVGLAFENETGGIELVNSDGLNRLFSLFKGIVECVILNACYSEEIAATISYHDIYVIGMNNEISDEAAKKFSVGFYQAYASGKGIEVAFQMGLIHIANIPDDKDVPTIWKKGIKLNI